MRREGLLGSADFDLQGVCESWKRYEQAEEVIESCSRSSGYPIIQNDHLECFRYYH